MIKYDSYRNSLIDWLGDVPKHWSDHRVNEIGTLIRGNTGFKKDELLDKGEYVALQYGKTYQVDEVSNAFQYFVNSEFYKKNQIVSRGDTILISTSETIEDLGHSCLYNRDDLGLIGGEQILFKPNRKLVIGKYLYYYSKTFSTELRKYATGLKVFRFNIDDLKKIFIAKPSLEEQTAIAIYLDTKTQFIDKKVNLLDKKIGYYQELRKSLINETVTKGLDTSVKLKESGIDWIGTIPDHWETKRFKSFAKTIKGKNLDTSDYQFEKSLPLLSLEYLRNDNVKFDTYAFSADKSLIASNKDLIIVWDGAAVGEILKAKEGYISSTIAKIKFQREVSDRFFYFLRDTLDYTLKQIPTGMGIPHLNPTILNNFPFPIPPITEQLEISEYLEKKIGLIEKAIINIKSQIIILKELRKTLINDVVTGKIKVIND